MKKYKVHGTTTITVYKEVWADNEDDAMDKAYNQLYALTEYCGNGGCDKLVGVESIGEYISVYDNIHYDDVEFLEDISNYEEE